MDRLALMRSLISTRRLPTLGRLGSIRRLMGIVVRYLHDGGAFFVRLLQQIRDHFPLARMQAARGLVRQDQFWLADQYLEFVFRGLSAC